MRNKIKIIPLIICVSLLILGCVNPVLEHLEQGGTYADKEQWDEAIIEYSKAIELDPEFAPSYYCRGLAYHGKGDLDRAIADFDKAINLNPEFALAYFCRGFAYVIKGEVTKAVSDYEKVIELSDDPALVTLAQRALDELRQ